MQISSAIAIAKKMLTEHGFGHVPIVLDNAKRRAGMVSFKSNGEIYRMSLSRNYIPLNEECEIRGVILHEIAHMIVGSHHGHDAIWKAACRGIGGDGSRIRRKADMPEGRYQGVCETCGADTGAFHRLSSRMMDYAHTRDKGKIKWFDSKEGRWLTQEDIPARRNRIAY